MDTIKIKLENPTGNRFLVNFPGHRVEIPPYAYGENSVVIDLPDLPIVGRWLDSLISKHRAIKVTPVESDEGCFDPDESDNDELVQNPGPDESVPVELDPDESDNDETLDLFKLDVISAKETGGGWWTVEMKDIEDIKVRGCEDEDAAIIEAFNKYMKG